MPKRENEKAIAEDFLKEMLEADDTGIYPVKYEDTEHYEVTRAFLNNPEQC